MPMKARELTTKALFETTPRLQTKEESSWMEAKVDQGALDINEARGRWYTRVPGSLAPDHTLLGAIQAMENKGYDVTEAEALIPIMQKAFDEHDDVKMLQYYAKLFEVLGRAPKIPDHPYWSYAQYESFDDHAAEVTFPAPRAVPDNIPIFERQHAGWIAQVAGAAVGTIIEGYCTDKLRETFGEIYGYLREPTTYNDDVLFELAFLNAVRDHGSKVTSEDIGMEWIGRIEYTWTAEEAAFRNMKRGIFPPMSAKVNNPWNEWIGAQMRGSVCGMVAPGDPELAARLAWIDGAVSHVNNGILGEVFNAVMTALAYVETNIRKVLEDSIALMPPKSEYYSVVKFAWDACRRHDAWEPTWRECEEKYKRYNWIHTYPNAAAEVVALYFAGNDFDECMHIIAMCGQDVDCNGGQIATLYGAMMGYAAIDHKWSDPFQDKFDSLFRGYEHTTLSFIAQLTMDAAQALKG